jgi:hypothetical protein
MNRVVAVDRKAEATEVRGHADELRALAVDADFQTLRLREDGTLVVHSDEPGYRSVNRFSTAATEIVGQYVNVITDDVPGAINAGPL